MVENNPIIFLVDSNLIQRKNIDWLNVIDYIISFVSDKRDCYFAVLGKDLFWSQQEWQELSSGEIASISGSHFLLPIFHRLQRIDLNPGQFVLITDENIFDLEDWIEIPDQWVLISEKLDLNERIPTKFLPDDLDSIYSWFSKTGFIQINKPRFRTTGSFGHRWFLDFSNFPMIFIPETNFYWHLFPMTWPQWETSQFFSHQIKMDEGDYRTFLDEIGGRVSLRNISTKNYLDVFASGLYPGEIISFLEHLDESYRLPTANEWKVAWKFLENQPLSALPPQIESHLSPLASKLWLFSKNLANPQNLLEFSMMKHGVLEWVLTNNELIENNLAGMGKPKKHYPFYYPITHHPIGPTSIEKRSKLFGLRLMRREEW